MVVAHTVIGIIANITSLVPLLSPLAEIKQMCDDKRTQTSHPLQNIALAISYAFWIIYASITKDNPVFVMSSIGLVVELAFICTFFIHTGTNFSRLITVLLVLAGSVALNIVCPVAFICYETLKERLNLLGICCVILGLITNIAPVSDVGTVIKSRNEDSIPYWKLTGKLINSLFWVAYSLTQFDLFILVNNLITVGTLIGALEICFHASRYIVKRARRAGRGRPNGDGAEREE